MVGCIFESWFGVDYGCWWDSLRGISREEKRCEECFKGNKR